MEAITSPAPVSGVSSPLRPAALAAARWERGRYEHHLVLDDVRLARIVVGDPKLWDGVYRWALVDGAVHGLAPSLRIARRQVTAALGGAQQQALFDQGIPRPQVLSPLPAWVTAPRITPAQALWLAHASPDDAAAFLARGPAHASERMISGHREYLPCVRGVSVGAPQGTAKAALDLADTALMASRAQSAGRTLDEAALGLEDEDLRLAAMLAQRCACLDRLLHLGSLLPAADFLPDRRVAALEALQAFDPTRENLRALSGRIPFPASVTRVVSKQPQHWLLAHALPLGLLGFLGRVRAPSPRRVLKQRAATDAPRFRWFYADSMSELTVQAIHWVDRTPGNLKSDS